MNNFIELYESDIWRTDGESSRNSVCRPGVDVAAESEGEFGDPTHSSLVCKKAVETSLH